MREALRTHKQRRIHKRRWSSVVCVLLAVSGVDTLGSCSTGLEDPVFTTLQSERQRLLEISQQETSRPPDFEAVKKSLQDAREPLSTHMSGVEPHNAITTAIQFCGGSLHETSSGPSQSQLGSETKKLFVRFTGIRLETAVCVIQRLVHGPSLTFIDTFECEEQRQSITCTLALDTVQIINEPPEDPEPSPPAADASKAITKLYEEVRSLREQTASARQTLAEFSVWGAQLDTLRRLSVRRDRQAELVSLAAAVCDTGFQPGRFAFEDFTLSVSGVVPSKAAQQSLVALRSPENVALHPGDLRVDPFIADVGLKDLPAIKADKPARRGAGQINIYAVDAEAMWLYSPLATGEESLVSTTVRDALFTGHLQASSPGQARALLKQEQPGLIISPLNRKSLRGKGAKVTVDVTGARLPQLLEMLGTALGVSVTAPQDGSELTVNVKNTSAEALLRAIAKTLGLSPQVRPGLWMLTPASSGKAPKRSGPRLDFAAADITASEALVVLNAVYPTAVTVTCDSPTINLHLADVYHSDAVQALFVNANLPWPPPGASPCTKEITALDTPPQKLAALAITKDGGVALLRNRVGSLALLDKEIALPDGSRAAVTKTGVTITAPAGEETSLVLTRPESGSPVYRGARLAATLVGHGKPKALIELSNGDWRLLQEGPQIKDSSTQVAIEATKITVMTDGIKSCELHLRRRLRR